MSFSKVILLGNLTRDPELKTTPNGANLANFTVAVNRNYTAQSGEKQTETAFIDCVAWGKTGETISKYFTKGRQILVSGRLNQRIWQDKDTGKNRSALDIVVEEFSFVADGHKAEPKNDNSPISGDSIDLSDIPF
ncbi:MAG: single-stranded DNA-binding protein [bacterium]|nr:single-stranded DNA-binding protein [bacterium]